MDNYIESSKKNKKRHGDMLFYGVVIVLLIVIICIIVYKDYLQDDITNDNNTSSNIDLIDGYWGDYNIYLTDVDSESLGNEYMLILYEPDSNDSQGFFQITTASSMEYNSVISGYYGVSDGKITFSQNLGSDEEKSNFATYLGVGVSDLYQNEDEVAEGYNYLYNVDLTYTDSSVSSSTITFKLAS